MIRPFDAAEIEALGSYVYVYSDPRNGKPFYIGKGYGNRAFAHLTEEGESAKVARIREIRESSLEPQIEVLAFGLDETTAFKVEAAAIDLIGFENLTNLVVGHGANKFGRMSLDEVHGRLSSTPVESFADDCVLIRISDTWADSSKRSAVDLYDATRGSWRVSLTSASKAKYALATYGGIVHEVYEIAAWLPAASTMYVNSDRDRSASDRFEFVGRIASAEVRNRYRWKSVAHYFKPGAANPILYVGPHRGPIAAENSASAQLPLTAVDDTAIVAARSAYPEYLASSSYICQPERYFRNGVTRLGFYNGGEIKPEIATIEYVEESVIFSIDEAERRMRSDHEHIRRVGELILTRVHSGDQDARAAHKVMLLSSADSGETIRLDHAIVNDKVTASGKPWGWTLGQRYVSLEALQSGATRTSQLEPATLDED